MSEQTADDEAIQRYSHPVYAGLTELHCVICGASCWPESTDPERPAALEHDATCPVGEAERLAAQRDALRKEIGGILDCLDRALCDRADALMAAAVADAHRDHARAWSAAWKAVAKRVRVSREAFRNLSGRHMDRLRVIEEVDKEHAECAFNLPVAMGRISALAAENARLLNLNAAVAAENLRLREALVISGMGCNPEMGCDHEVDCPLAFVCLACGDGWDDGKPERHDTGCVLAAQQPPAAGGESAAQELRP